MLDRQWYNENAISPMITALESCATHTSYTHSIPAIVTIVDGKRKVLNKDTEFQLMMNKKRSIHLVQKLGSSKLLAQLEQLDSSWAVVDIIKPWSYSNWGDMYVQLDIIHSMTNVWQLITSSLTRNHQFIQWLTVSMSMSKKYWTAR